MFGKIILCLIVSFGILTVGFKYSLCRDPKMVVQQALGKIWMLLGAALSAFTLVMGAFAVGTGIVQIGNIMGIVLLIDLLIVGISLIIVEVMSRLHLDTQAS